jgi:predicted 2-oxoglutarate/Fe(II)-dependent dioxygenase YbiX
MMKSTHTNGNTQISYCVAGKLVIRKDVSIDIAYFADNPLVYNLHCGGSLVLHDTINAHRFELFRILDMDGNVLCVSVWRRHAEEDNVVSGWMADDRE